MKKLYTSKKTAGIGLIEVLITTVVVALGLLAVASFQGSLIGESRENKSRTEAKALAESKIEEFRDAIIRDVLVAGVVPAVAPFLPADTTGATDTVAGVTESFTRTWSVSDQAVPERKEIEVSICWSDGCPLATGNTNNQIYVQGEVVFDNVANSAKNLKDAQSAAGTTGSPSTNANSSDEINDATDVDISGSTAGSNSLHSIDGLESGQYVKDNGNSDDKGSIVYLCDDLIPFENGLYTRRVHYNPSGTTFKDAIELFEDNLDSLTCTRKIRFNGGIILAIKGVIYSRATTGTGGNVTLLELRNNSGTNLFTFNASESGSFCVFVPLSGSTSSPYICYVGGNCINGPVGTTATTDGIVFSTASVNSNTIVTQCPAPIASPSPSPIYGSSVYSLVGPGGWRGKVGLLGIPESSKNVCFSEELIEIAQQQSDQYTLDTARNYFTRRLNNTISTNEGINQPYNCHDMMIINGQQTTVQVHDECISESASITGLELASKNIQRDLSGTAANTVIVTADNSFCANSTPVDYTITGSISDAASTPTVSISDGSINGDCTSTPATTTAYTCTITTAASSVTITGSDNSGSASCFITPVSSTGCNLAFTQVSGQRTVTAAITPTGTGSVSNIVVTGTDATCVGTECTVASDWTGTLTATADCDGTPSSVTGTSSSIGSTNTTTSITLGTCTSSTVLRTISGTVSVDNLVDTLTILSINVNGEKCSGNLSKISNTTSAYTCSVIDGTDITLGITIGPTCNKKKYTITAFSSSVTGVSPLTVNLGTINSNTSVNVAITRSSTGC